MKDYTQYKLDAEISPTDQRDWVAETIYPAEVKYPTTLDYRNELSAVRDQGSQGSCVAQVGACMKEWQEYHNIGFDEYMSPQFIYNLREYEGSGMFPRTLMKILQKSGSLPEYLYPYGTMDEITEEHFGIAEEFVIKHYAQINTVDGLKSALYKNGPCEMTIPIYHYENQIWKPIEGLEKLLGAHAVTIVGYNSKGFIIRNSWGDDWNDKGYIIFPYEDWGMQYEVWTTIDENSSNPDVLSKWKSMWYYFTKWLNDKKGTLIYFVLIAIFLGYVIIDKFL
jgi:hypothetical protein